MSLGFIICLVDKELIVYHSAQCGVIQLARARETTTMMNCSKEEVNININTVLGIISPFGGTLSV